VFNPIVSVPLVVLTLPCNGLIIALSEILRKEIERNNTNRS
jgi:hypothetical protein